MKMLQLGCPPHPGWSTFLFSKPFREWIAVFPGFLKIHIPHNLDDTHREVGLRAHSNCYTGAGWMYHIPLENGSPLLTIL